MTVPQVQRRKHLLIPLLLAAGLGVGLSVSGGVSLIPEAGPFEPEPAGPVLSSRQPVLPAPQAPINIRSMPDQETAAQGREADAPRTAPASSQAIISGRVIDDFGRGVSEALVAARIQAEGSVILSVTAGQAAFMARTDDEGCFKLSLPNESLTPDRAIVVIQAAAQGFEGSDPKVLRVKRGEDREGVELLLSQSADATGRVVDRDGNPISDVIVRAIQLTGPEEQSLVLIRSNVKTDSEGRYKLSGLRDGPCAVMVGEIRSGGVGLTTDAQHGVFLDRHFFTAAPGQTQALPDIVLGPPTILRLQLLTPDGTAPSIGTVVSLRMPVLGQLGYAAPGLVQSDGIVQFVGLPASQDRITHVAGRANGEQHHWTGDIAIHLGEGQTYDAGIIQFIRPADSAATPQSDG